MHRIVLVTLLGLAACGGDNPLREHAQGIAAAATTARSVSLAIGAVTGISASGCVQATTACTTYPCAGAAQITLGDACPLPLATGVTGQITVNGMWSSATDASVQVVFVDVKESASTDAIALTKVTSISATSSGETIHVSYSGSNAGARSGLSNVAVGGSSTWDVDIDTKGTDNAADDVLTVSSTSAGGSAGLGASAKVASLSGITISPDCALNPTAGSGQITEVQTFIPKITNISFHASCDGKGIVNGDAYDFDTRP